MFVQGSTENQFYWVDSLIKNYNYNYFLLSLVITFHRLHWSNKCGLLPYQQKPTPQLKSFIITIIKSHQTNQKH